MPSRRDPDPFAVQVGERIRQLRKERQLSLPALAQASGISRGHLSDIERGMAVMTLRTLLHLADALEVPPYLICMVPKDDPQVVVIDYVIARAGGDMKKAAEELRALILEHGVPNGDASDVNDA